VIDERWRQVKELFLAAVEQPVDARDAFIDAAPTDDEVRCEVRTLIASDTSEASYLDRLPLVTDIPIADVSFRTTLAPGSLVAHYEIVALAGQGSMGDVYRAHDTTLNRDVALKVLPPELAVDVEFLARFRHEARVLATLNHQNIAGIYGVAESAEVTALVLEFAGGPTLAAQMAAGPLRSADALRIAQQVAAGLEAAHEKGIVHRDLKPANITVQPDGTVKILDFGLAKIAAQSTGLMMPTISTDATQPGLILGTAAYMSPEQACGKPVDRRADLWSFGVLLMEMLTGRPVFAGETVSDVIAAVLKTEPDWTTLPVDTPASVRRLLRRCLDKDPRRRRASAADVRLDLDDALELPPANEAEHRRRPYRSYLTVGASGIAGAVLLALAWNAWPRGTLASAGILIPVRFTVEAAPGAIFRPGRTSTAIAISPEGTYFVYVVGSEPGSADQHLETRAVDSLTAAPLGELKGAHSPVFSPDGQSVAFWGGRVAPLDNLWRMPINGGAPVPICAPIPHGRGIQGMAWADDDTIWFATADPATGLWRVPARGGQPILVTTPDSAQGELDHLFPDPLPGGRGVLFTITSVGGASKSRVAVLDLRAGRIKTLIQGGEAKYLKTGHILYVSGRSLRAAAFDPETLSITSEPVTVLSGLRTDGDTGAGDFAVSAAGTLAYVPATPFEQRTLTWVDPSGNEEAIAAPPRPYTRARVSPDGSRIAVSIADGNRDVWVWDIARQALTRITNDPMLDDAPTWSVDGNRIIFGSNRGGLANLYSHAADGTGDDVRLTTSTHAQRPDSVGPDGRLVFTENLPGGSWGLMLLNQSPTESTSSLNLSPPFNRNGEISPNGRWIAYESDRAELFVSPFPNVSRARWQISRSFGVTPVWSHDGRKLFYRAAEALDGSDRKSELVAVSVSSDPDFHVTAPTPLFPFVYRGYNAADRTYDVARDGRFVMIKDAPPTSEKPHFVVVLNWFEELKRLTQAK